MTISSAGLGWVLGLLASGPAPQEVRHVHEADAGLGVAAHGRFAFPFGSADRDVTVIAGGGGALILIDEHLSWAELFHEGWGAELEFDFFLGGSRDSVFGPQASFRYGGYVAVGLDHFEGDGESDDAGNSIEVDDLDIATIFAGPKVVTSLGDGSRMDGRVGLGVVGYSAVDATFSGPTTPAFEAEFLEGTWTLAFELRGHWGMEAGPFAIVLGLGCRAMVPPHEGSAMDLSPGAFFTFDLDLGVELAF